MEDEALKSCPFCGGEAGLYCTSLDLQSYYVKCVQCLAKSQVMSTETKAYEKWNARAGKLGGRPKGKKPKHDDRVDYGFDTGA